MKLKKFFNSLVCAGLAAVVFASSASGQKEKTVKENQPDNLKPELYVQTGHSKAIGSIAFSPDGKLLASGSADKTVRLYDVASGQELRTLIGYKLDSFVTDSDDINYLNFSADGKILSSVAKGGIIRLWDVETGKVLGTSNRSYTGYFAAAFAADGQTLATAFGKEVRILRVTPGDENQPPPREIQDMMADMAKMIPNAKPSDMKVTYDIQPTIKELQKFEAGIGLTYSLALAPNGKILAISGTTKTVELWNAETGKLQQSIPHTNAIFDLAFSPDGKILATMQTGSPKEIRLFDSQTGAELKSFTVPDAHSMAFAEAGKTLAIQNNDGKTQFYDVESGTAKKTFETGKPGGIIAVSPDAKILATAGSGEKSVRLHSVETGAPLQTLTGRVRENRSIILSPDGKRLANSGATTIDVWDLENGQKLSSLSSKASIYSVAFSPDGKFLASGEGLGFGGSAPANLNYGDRINLQLGGQNTASRHIKIWSVENGREVSIFAGHESDISALNFSEDGKQLFSGDYNQIKVWDVAGKKLLRTINRDDETVKDIETLNEILPRVNQKQRKNYAGAKEYSAFQAFDEAATPDGKFKFQITENGKLEITETETKKLLATLIATDDGEWLVVTPDGLFDGTPKAWKSAVWRLGGNTFNRAPVEVFFKEFYYPGLLQEIMRGATPKLPAKDLASVDVRQPQVKIVEVAGKSTASNNLMTDQRNAFVTIEITDNVSKTSRNDFPPSAGASDLRLFRNGSLVRLWEKDVFALGEADGCRQTPASGTQSRKAVCQTTLPMIAGENALTAYAFNHDNVKSDDAVAFVIGADSLKRRGKINILSIGVNEYHNKNYNLKYAVPDATDFGLQLRKQQLNLKNYDTPEVVSLTDSEATKPNILYALERFAKGDKAQMPENLPPALKAKLSAIEKNQPEDALVVYFAGHGTARCETDDKTKQANCDRFFLIPHDGFPTETAANAKKSRDSLYAGSISDIELEAAVRELDAGELMLVVDACNSGQALESAEKRRGPMNSRGLAQLAYEKGMYILTAAQSQQAALEVSKFGHGLLTYALLEGFQKAEKDSAGNVTERKWLDYATLEVPQLQVEAMRTRSAENKVAPPARKRSELAVATGDNTKLPPEKRGLQVPRIFYRRELEASPLIVAKP